MGSVLTMEQGALLQHPMSMHGDYSLTSDADCIDTHYTGHAHHYQPVASGTLDHYRRDGGLPHPSAASFAFTAANHPHVARPVPDRGVVSDQSSYQTTSNLTDSSSGSFSTSPSSAASSLAYNYPGPANHCTSVPSYPGAVPHLQAFAGSHAARVPSIFSNGSTQCMLPPPPPLTTPAAVDTTHREAYATESPYLTRTPLSTHTQGFTYDQTPRSVHSAATSLSPGLASYPYPAMAQSSNGYGSASNGESLNFPWPNLEILLDITCEGQAVTPEVHAKVEKGFFLSTVDQKWTCYRRNYFSVATHFTLTPNINNGRMYLKRNNHTEQIQAMGMRLSAAVDGSNGKSIELIQHTPKRDNGPKNKIDVTKVSPTPSGAGRGEHSISPNGVYQLPMSTFHATGAIPGPFLPLQSDSNGASAHQTPQLSSQYPYQASVASHIASSGQHPTHTFERVQFKQATANNGKRRASQQYFHLIVELFADVRKDGSDNPVWVKVAQRVSDKIVVRGRSPSHYQNEGGNGQAGRGSASGGSSYGGGSGYHGMSTGGFRSSAGGYSSMAGASGYRGTQYGMHPSSDGSGSSPGSVDEGAMDDHPADAVMSDNERAEFQQFDGYQYYPGPVYEQVAQPTLPPLSKIEGRYSTDPRQYAVKAEYADAVPGAQWQVGGCNRFQGVDTSRGYFPDLATGFS